METEKIIEMITTIASENYMLGDNSEFLEQDNQILARFEGENHAMVSIWFDLDVMEELNSVEVLSYVLSTIIYRLRQFDADEEFNELWSTEFGEHNRFSPSEFIEMLKDDEEQFYDKAAILEQQYNEIRKALQWVEFYN
ncbi:hypothetical protein [Enterococcus cecorum]|uniref:hypothetical protein n=1 Tax=Enterococcus cecorum TaxID=44008 RepID=UPI00148C25EA|nr:hypothetical protein [Enterococcus cecorum]